MYFFVSRVFTDEILEAVAVAKALLDGRVNEKRANARRDGPGGSSGDLG